MKTYTVHEAVRHLERVARESGLGDAFYLAEQEAVAHIQRQLKLPPAVVTWYVTATPRNVQIPSFGNSPILFDVMDLPAVLTGYRCDAITGKDVTSWDQTWVVIGGEGPYPVIVRTAETHDPFVYYAEITKQKRTRLWHLTVLSTTFQDFLAGIASYITLYVGTYGGRVCDDACIVLPAFWNDFAQALNDYPGTYGRVTEWLTGWLGY